MACRIHIMSVLSLSDVVRPIMQALSEHTGLNSLVVYKQKLKLLLSTLRSVFLQIAKPCISFYRSLVRPQIVLRSSNISKTMAEQHLVSSMS